MFSFISFASLLSGLTDLSLWTRGREHNESRCIITEQDVSRMSRMPQWGGLGCLRQESQVYVFSVCVCVCVCDDQNLDPQPILRTSMFVCVYRIRMSLFSSECVEMMEDGA